MNKLFHLVLIIGALDFCFTRPAKNNKGKTKSNNSNCGGNVPTFMVIPLYDNVTLTCPFTAQTIAFFKNCKSIPRTQNMASTKYTVSGNSLTLNRFTIMDGGVYVCKGTNANGETKQFTWALHLETHPIRNSKQNKEKPVGGGVIIDCRYFPGEAVYYSHIKGQQLTVLSSGRLRSSRNLHQLSDLTIDDTGFYYCGKNMVMHLAVKELPKVSGVTLAKAGDNVLLKCVYKGEQEIAWYKDNVTITRNTTTQLHVITKKQFLYLRLTNFTSKESGTYGCGVKFDDNTVFTTIELNLFSFSDQVGIYGSPNMPNGTVMIICTSNQEDKTNYTLFRKPVLGSQSYRAATVRSGIQQGGSGIQQVQAGSGVFYIASVSHNEEGYYKCRASRSGVSIEKELDRVIWLSPSS